MNGRLDELTHSVSQFLMESIVRSLFSTDGQFNLSGSGRECGRPADPVLRKRIEKFVALQQREVAKCVASALEQEWPQGPHVRSPNRAVESRSEPPASLICAKPASPIRLIRSEPRATGHRSVSIENSIGDALLIFCHDAVINRPPGLAAEITPREEPDVPRLQSGQRLYDLANALPIMIWISEKENRPSYLNQAWRDFTGRTLKEELEPGCFASVHPEDTEDCQRTYEDAHHSRRPFEIEYRLKRHDDEHCWVRDIGQPRYHHDGTFAGFVGVVLDIHERKQSQQRLQLLQADLAHSQRASAMGQMASVLAHEINQPLGTIATFAQAAAGSVRNGNFNPEELADVLDKIAEQALAGGQITRRIKAYVSKSAPQESLLDVNRLVRDVVAVLRNDAELRFTKIELVLDPQAADIRGDSVQLQQVLVNLIRNGIDAMAQIPRRRRMLRVETRTAAEEISVLISDRGPGLSDESMRRLFEPYFTTKSDGLGVGLSISRTIVTSHGGRIEAHRNPEEGMTFKVSLPAAKTATCPAG